MGLLFSSEEEDIIGLWDDVHVKQSDSWDCGIACCAMALRWVGNVTDASPLEVDKKTPLWTIDLYCFLRERGVETAYSTDVPGINEQHEKITWYQKHLDGDRARVEEKFAVARLRGWPVTDGLSTEELADLFKAECGPRLDTHHSDDVVAMRNINLAAIVLVNNLHLARDRRNGGLSAPPGEAYQGHYVFLVGFDSPSGDALYLDPAHVSSVPRRCSADLFAAARDSAGTDRDVLTLRRSQTH